MRKAVGGGQGEGYEHLFAGESDVNRHKIQTDGQTSAAGTCDPRRRVRNSPSRMRSARARPMCRRTAAASDNTEIMFPREIAHRPLWFSCHSPEGQSTRATQQAVSWIPYTHALLTCTQTPRLTVITLVRHLTLSAL